MEPQFKEVQRFNQWWLWLIVTIPIVVSLFIEFFSNGMDAAGMAFQVILSLLTLGFIFSMKLVTIVDQEGVHLKFFPFINKTRLYAWTDIESFEIRQYKPIAEYGGWGVKGSFKYGRAYNVRGDKGLQLILKDGKKVLIGTQQENALKAALEKVNKK